MTDTGSRPRELGGDRRSHAPVPAGCPSSHVAALIEALEDAGGSYQGLPGLPGQAQFSVLDTGRPLVWVGGVGPWCDPDEFNDNNVAYFIALHEFGHLRLGHGMPPRGSLDQLLNEIDAWRWALSNAVVPPSKDAWATLEANLGSYVDEFIARRRP